MFDAKAKPVPFSREPTGSVEGEATTLPVSESNTETATVAASTGAVGGGPALTHPASEDAVLDPLPMLDAPAQSGPKPMGHQPVSGFQHAAPVLNAPPAPIVFATEARYGLWSGSEQVTQACQLFWQHQKNTLYDSLGLAADFVHQADQALAQKKGCRELLAQRQAAWHETLSAEDGGSCIARAVDLADQLKAMGLPAYVAGLRKTERKDGDPQFCHTVVIVPFEDPISRGVLLFDEARAQPVLCRKTAKSVNLDEGTIRVSEPEHGVITLREWSNPDASLGARAPLWLRKYHRARFTTDRGILGMVVLDMAKRQVVLIANQRKSVLSFNDRKEIEAALTEDLAKVLRTTPDALWLEISAVIDHEQLLKKWRKELDVN